MSNLGLERFPCQHAAWRMHRTKVGDRYVAERMREIGMNLGGEQSGHLILSDFATTGDGLLAALQVLAVIVEQGRSAREVCRVFTPLPQLLKNVRFAGASPLRDKRIQQAIAAAEAAAGRQRPPADPRERHRAADPRHGGRRGRGPGRPRGRRAVRDDRRGDAGARGMPTDARPRAGDRRFGFRRRRRHPGGHQDDHGIRCATPRPRSPR